WNLAALCQARNWSTAIVDTDMQPLSAWAAPESCHVYTKEPTGYRVVIDLLAHEKPADLTCIVTFADALRIAHWQDVRMGQASTWIINHHGINDPMPAVDTIVDAIVLIPHDPRHVAAQFLRKPLVTLDPSFARHFDHLMQKVEHLVQVKSVGKEVEFDVGVSGV
ncbi:hypothetical protein, partial [Sulfoacidibacillus ferrooxidans]